MIIILLNKIELNLYIKTDWIDVLNILVFYVFITRITILFDESYDYISFSIKKIPILIIYYFSINVINNINVFNIIEILLSIILFSLLFFILYRIIYKKYA